MHKFLRSLIKKYKITPASTGYEFVGRKKSNYIFTRASVPENGLNIKERVNKSDLKVINHYKDEIKKYIIASQPMQIFPCF